MKFTSQGNKPCLCGSEHKFKKCCGAIMADKMIATTPEQLMRSRYAAYVVANVDYLVKSQRGPAALGFNARSAASWAKSVEWLGLTVQRSWMNPFNPDIGYVEFTARYRDANGEHKMHEVSEFHFMSGEWFYYTGQ